MTHVTLVILYVTNIIVIDMCHRALLVTDFNKVLGGGKGGQKVVPRPSATTL
jgi:hypothetical protein